MAVEWEGQLDPGERLDFVADFALGDNPVLADGETIASFSLAVTAAAAALGLTIEQEGEYAPALVNADTAIQLWLTVAPEMQNDEAFAAGVSLGVVATIQTNSVPPRTRERTYLAQVAQL